MTEATKNIKKLETSARGGIKNNLKLYQSGKHEMKLRK